MGYDFLTICQVAARRGKSFTAGRPRRIPGTAGCVKRPRWCVCDPLEPYRIIRMRQEGDVKKGGGPISAITEKLGLVMSWHHSENGAEPPPEEPPLRSELFNV